MYILSCREELYVVYYQNCILQASYQSQLEDMKKEQDIEVKQQCVYNMRCMYVYVISNLHGQVKGTASSVFVIQTNSLMVLFCMSLTQNNLKQRHRAILCGTLLFFTRAIRKLDVQCFGTLTGYLIRDRITVQLKKGLLYL